MIFKDTSFEAGKLLIWKSKINLLNVTTKICYLRVNI